MNKNRKESQIFLKYKNYEKSKKDTRKRKLLDFFSLFLLLDYLVLLLCFIFVSCNIFIHTSSLRFLKLFFLHFCIFFYMCVLILQKHSFQVEKENNFSMVLYFFFLFLFFLLGHLLSMGYTGTKGR